MKTIIYKSFVGNEVHLEINDKKHKNKPCVITRQVDINLGIYYTANYPYISVGGYIKKVRTKDKKRCSFVGKLNSEGKLKCILTEPKDDKYKFNVKIL